MTILYQLIVFDWEGTLGDELGRIIQVVHSEAERMGLGSVNEARIRHYFSLGWELAIKKLFPDASLPQQEALLQLAQKAFSTRHHDVYLFPKAKELLQKLHEANIPMAIASNKGLSSLQRDLQQAGLEPFFSIVRTASTCLAKPCPQMLAEIIDYCGTEAAKTLVVGDAVTDIEMARSLAVDAVGVNFYHQPGHANDLLTAGALAVFEGYDELAHFLGMT